MKIIFLLFFSSLLLAQPKAEDFHAKGWRQFNWGLSMNEAEKKLSAQKIAFQGGSKNPNAKFPRLQWSEAGWQVRMIFDQGLHQIQMTYKADKPLQALTEELQKQFNISYGQAEHQEQGHTQVYTWTVGGNSLILRWSRDSDFPDLQLFFNAKED